MVSDEVRLCACGCKEPIPLALLAYARDHHFGVKYASVTHRNRAMKRRHRARNRKREQVETSA